MTRLQVNVMERVPQYQGTGSRGWIRANTLCFIDHLVPDPHTLDRLFAEVGLKRSVLDNPYAVIAAAQMARLLELTSARLGITDLGLRLAAHQRELPSTDPIELAIFNAPTLRDAFLFGERHVAYFSPAVRFHVEPADDGVRLLYSFADNEIAARHATEYGCLLACRNIIDLAGGRPREVWLRHPRISPIEVYEAHFQAPVRFGMPIDAVYLDAETFHRPIAGHDPRLYERGQRIAAMREAEDKPLSAHLPAEIERLLPRQQCSYDRVCDNMGFASRTMRRYLAGEHTTFKELKNSVRRRIVQECLGERGMRKADAARSAGYSDAASIRRNVKRWF